MKSTDPCFQEILEDVTLTKFEAGVAVRNKESKLTEEFFRRPSVTVAQDLLGRDLYHMVEGEIRKLTIFETQAYTCDGDTLSYGRILNNSEIEVCPGMIFISPVDGFNTFNIYCNNHGQISYVNIRSASLSGGLGGVEELLPVDFNMTGQSIVEMKNMWIEGKVFFPYTATPRTGYPFVCPNPNNDFDLNIASRNSKDMQDLYRFRKSGY